MVLAASVVVAVYFGTLIEDVGYRKLLNKYYWGNKK